jgi:hypothetical protein
MARSYRENAAVAVEEHLGDGQVVAGADLPAEASFAPVRGVAHVALENSPELTWPSRHLGHSSTIVTDTVYGHWARVVQRVTRDTPPTAASPYARRTRSFQNRRARMASQARTSREPLLSPLS